MAQRQAQQQSSVAIYVVAASVIAAGYLAWLRYPSTPAVLAGFLIAAWIEPPAILTGKKDASGFPTPAHAGEEKTLGRSQFWQGMKWRLVLPSTDWLPGWPVFGAWYAGVAAGAFCLGLPLEDRRWAPANAAAIFVTVATVAAVRRRTSAEGDSPGTRLDSFAPALLENPVVAAGVAVGSLVATAAAVWAARMYLPESHQVPLGAMVPAFALVMVMAFAAWPWSNAALSHWRVVVAGRREWRPRWQSLKHDPAPFLIDREEVGSARVDTFEAPPGVGAVGYRLLGPKITPTIGAGSAVAVLECPNEDDNGPMPGTLHPLRFQVVVWPSGDLPDLTDPDLNDDVAVLRARCGIPWAVDTPGYLRAVLVDAEKITSEDSPTAAWRSRWEFPEGPNLTVYRTELLGNISDGFGCQVLIDHRGGVLYFGDLTSGNADFVEGDAQARTLVRLETEDEWNGVWGQVLKQGTNPPTLQHDATADQELADGTVVHRVPWMTRLGIDPGDYRGLEPKLATGLNAAPFVAITGWPRKGDRLGERHPQAFVVYHSRSEVPASPENLAPSPASAWVLAGHVNMAFDAARLARPELVRATALTVAESRHHIWNIRLRLYGGVTLADVRGQAHRLRQAFGVEWLRVDGADDGCSLYLGRQPKSRTVRLARPERDLLRLTALDWSQAWIDSGVTGVGGLVPTLTGSGRLPKNDAVEVLDFALPAGVDPVKVKGATAKLATATGNEFVEVRAGVEPSSVRLLVCEVNPLPDRIDFDFEEVDRSDGIPFATGVEGEPVTFVFTDSPHALVAGLTGSGKSVMAQGIIYGALVRGWQLYIIDPVKGGADFAFAKDRCVAFAGTPFEAAGVIDAVYQEVVRRKNLNSKHGVGSYLELPDDIRPPHIAVLIDEFTSLLGQSPLPPKSDDVEMSSERDAIEAENYARTRVGVMAGKLAREARSAGVTLLLATQKLNAKMLDAIPGASDLKPLTLDSKLPVPVSEKFPDGWARNRDLTEGDLLYTPKGDTAEIIGFTPVQHGGRVFEVTFADGQKVRTGPGHWWLASDGRSRSRQSRRAEKVGSRRLAIAARAAEAAASLPGGTYLCPDDLAKIVGYANSARVVAYQQQFGMYRFVRASDGSVKPYDPSLRRGTHPRRFLVDDAIDALAVTRSWSNVDALASRSGTWLTAREIAEAVRGEAVSARTAGNLGTILTTAGCESKDGEPAPYLIAAPEFLYRLAEHLRCEADVDPETGEPAALERLVTTEEMAKHVHYRDGHCNWAVRVTDAIDGPELELPVDPYVLGAWLGDGSTGSGIFTQGHSVSCTDEHGVTDQERLMSHLDAAGYRPAVLDCDDNMIGTRGLKVALRAAGVLHDKHIPALYLRASRAQRLALLQGLMDTDGSVMASGTCSLPQRNHSIHRGALELIRSLGFRASTSSWDASYLPDGATEKKVTGRVHHISFSPNMPVFRLPRKLAKQKTAEGTATTTRWNFIRSIEEVDSEPVRCIGIDDPDHLYLVEEFIPTHNTNLARTLLGKASFGDRASALRAPDDAPKFDGALPIGRGLWEPVTAPASAMQVWFAPQETLRAELVARVPELPVSRRLDVTQFAPPELGGDAPAPPLGEAERVIDRGIFSFDLDDLDMFSDEEDDEAVDVSDDDEPAEVLVDQAAGNDGVPSAGPVMFLAGAGATTLPAGVEGWGLWERVGEVVASAEMIEALDDLGVTIIWVPAAGEELATVTDTFGLDPWPSLTVDGDGEVADRAAAVTAWVAAHPEVERVIYLDAGLAMEDPDTLDSFAEGVLAGLIDTPFDPNKMFVAAPTRNEGITRDMLENVAAWLLDLAPTPPPPAPTYEAGGPPQEPDQDPRPVLHVDDDELFPDLPRVSVPDGADPFA